MSSEGVATKADRAHAVAMAVVLIVVALYGYFNEHCPISNGRGWDGNQYVGAAVDLNYGWEVATTNPYLLQRLLPSLAVHAGLVITGAPKADPAALTGFAILNTLMMLITLSAWLALARRFRLTPEARWLGFIGLFVNVQCFKVAGWYPALTDIPALALGMAMITFYLTDRLLALAACTLLAVFTWPVAGPMGVLLVLFPRERDASDGSGDLANGVARTTTSSLPARVLGGLAALGVAILCGYHFLRGIRIIGFGDVEPIVGSLFPVSLSVTAAYVYFVVSGLLPEPGRLLQALRRLRPLNIALVISILALPRIAIALISSGAEWVTVTNFIPYVFLLSTTRPGIFLIAHVVFFGPILLLLPWVWKRMRSLVHHWGVGLQGYFILGLLVAACPDSRQSTLLWPLVVVTLVVACERAGLARRGLVMSLGALALLMSRIWLPFNIPSSTDETGWDMSRYFETQGSFISETHYVACLAVGGLLLLLLSMKLQAKPARPWTSQGKSGS